MRKYFIGATCERSKYRRPTIDPSGGRLVEAKWKPPGISRVVSIIRFNAQKSLKRVSLNMWLSFARAPLTYGQSNARAGIACTVLGSQINVQVVTLDNQLVFYRWTGTWSGPIAIATTISFSAVSCFTLNSRINTYFQRQGQHITEYRSNTSGDNFQPDKTDVPVRR